MKLTGDRNQCCGCGEYFNSTFAFDKHRTGDFGKDRRCLKADEMEAKGMSKNARGFWISSAMPLEVAYGHEGEPDPAVEHSFSMMARAAGWIGY
jgi:hypothetical protein